MVYNTGYAMVSFRIARLFTLSTGENFEIADMGKHARLHLASYFGRGRKNLYFQILFKTNFSDGLGHGLFNGTIYDRAALNRAAVDHFEVTGLG